MRQSIYLVGLMGVGKTAVGRQLAKLLARDFLDSDQVIEERAGVPVSWIFDLEGERAFRDREQLVIDELTAKDGIVLATGGGAVLRAENRRALRSRGCVVHLDGSIDQLLERVSRNKNRPLLQQGDPQQTLQRLHAERQPLYAEVADYRFLTSGGGTQALAEEIAQTLRGDGVVRD